MHAPFDVPFRLVPIYSIQSWLALRYHPEEIYFATARELYEAFVLWSFYKMLLEFFPSRDGLITVSGMRYLLPLDLPETFYQVHLLCVIFAVVIEERPHGKADVPFMLYAAVETRASIYTAYIIRRTTVRWNVVVPSSVLETSLVCLCVVDMSLFA